MSAACLNYFDMLECVLYKISAGTGCGMWAGGGAATGAYPAHPGSVLASSHSSCSCCQLIAATCCPPSLSPLQPAPRCRLSKVAPASLAVRPPIAARRWAVLSLAADAAADLHVDAACRQPAAQGGARGCRAPPRLPLVAVLCWRFMAAAPRPISGAARPPLSLPLLPGACCPLLAVLLGLRLSRERQRAVKRTASAQHPSPPVERPFQLIHHFKCLLARSLACSFAPPRLINYCCWLATLRASPCGKPDANCVRMGGWQAVAQSTETWLASGPQLHASVVS